MRDEKLHYFPAPADRYIALRLRYRSILNRQLQAVWGRQGISDGRFQRPRAMAIDRRDHIYIVDMTARIQVFTPDGTFINKWQTPDHQFGKPTGLSIGNDGNVLVANTHYYEVLIYSPDGQLIKRLGGTKGERPASSDL